MAKSRYFLQGELVFISAASGVDYRRLQRYLARIVTPRTQVAIRLHVATFYGLGEDRGIHWIDWLANKYTDHPAFRKPSQRVQQANKVQLENSIQIVARNIVQLEGLNDHPQIAEMLRCVAPEHLPRINRKLIEELPHFPPKTSIRELITDEHVQKIENIINNPTIRKGPRHEPVSNILSKFTPKNIKKEE